MTDQQESLAIAERIAGEAELEVMAFRSQDPEALDRLNAAMVKLRNDITSALDAARQVPEGHMRNPDGMDYRIITHQPSSCIDPSTGGSVPTMLCHISIQAAQRSKSE